MAVLVHTVHVHVIEIVAPKPFGKDADKLGCMVRHIVSMAQCYFTAAI